MVATSTGGSSGSVTIGGGGLQSVGTVAQTSGLASGTSRTSRGGGGGGDTTATISANLQSTVGGIVDIRTGKVIAPVGTDPAKAAQLAQSAFTEFKAAEAKAALEEKIKQRTIATEAEKSRQEEIFKGTIAGQVGERDSSISALDGRDPFVSGRDVGFGTATRVAISRGGTFLRESFRSPGQQRTVRGGDIFSGFRQVEVQKFEKPSGLLVKERPGGDFGTGPLILNLDTTSLTGSTFGEVQTATRKIREGAITRAQEKEQEGLTTSVSGLQQQINIGALSLEEARAQSKDLTTAANIRLQETSTRISKELPDVKGLDRRTSKVEGAFQFVGESAALFNPLTASVIGAVSAKEDPLKLQVSGIEQIKSAPSIESITTQRPSLRTASFFAATPISAGISLKATERAADRLLIEEVLGQRGTISGREVARVGQEASIFDITSLRKLGDQATLKTQIRAPVFKTGETSFSTTGGRGTSQLEFFSIAEGRQKTITESFGFGGRQLISEGLPTVGTRELRVGTKGLTGGFGEGFVQREGVDTFSTFKFGGVSRDIESGLGKITQVKAGRQQGLVLQDVTQLPKGGRLFGGAKGQFRIEEAGFIRRLTDTQPDVGVSISRPSSTRKTPFSSVFQEQVTTTSIQPPVGLTTSLERSLISPSSIVARPSATPRSLVGLPRAVGGAGLTQKQISRAQGSLAPLKQETLTTTQFPSPSRSSRGFQELGLFQTPTERGLSRTDSSLSLRGLQLPKQQPLVRQIPIQRQVSRQGLEQLQIQPLVQSIPSFAPRGFEPIGGFAFTPFTLPSLPSLGGRGTRGRPIRRGKARQTIRPSFTGIVLGIEEAAIVSPTFGVTPFSIRGLRTGLAPIKKKKKKKKKK